MSTFKPKFVEVVLDQALDKPLDYLVPDDCISLKIGMRVEVPLKNRLSKGTVFAIKEETAFKGVKPISKILGVDSAFSLDLFQLARWMSAYYLTPLSKILKSFMPPSVRAGKMTHKEQLLVKSLLSERQLRESCALLRRAAPAQARAIDVLLQFPEGILLTELLEKAKITRSAIDALSEKKIVCLIKTQVDRLSLFEHDFFPTVPKVLNASQQETLDAILKDPLSFKVHLIHGVTGSGKTEIYLQAIDAVLKMGKGVIFLIPEIALTAQTLERFKGRFGQEKIALLHHRLSHGERFDTWQNIKTGKAKIIIGARSALFSPVENLGMIVIDEEQEASYKQSEEPPKYHARDVSIMRAKFANCPILLGSATPSMESYYNAQNGKYTLHVLKQRADTASLPTVTVVDMRKEFEKAKGFTLFSEVLISAIKTRLTKGEQILLFLNRRGYHTFASCPACGHTIECPHCSTRLTYHLSERNLACHLCDYRMAPIKCCPQCKAETELKYKGFGTQRVEKALLTLFPEIRVLRLDADTTRHKGSHERIFKSFRSGKADVLLGTQMIAKGLHFSLVTLSAVLEIDASLNIPDFRSSEHVFQLLLQVAGRSGRGDLKGEVILQTKIPESPLFKLAALQDFDSFYKEEKSVRELFAFPPYTHLIKCFFSGENLEKCLAEANFLRTHLLKVLPSEVEVLPVIACGYKKIKGKFRFQFLIKTKKIQQTLRCLERVKGELSKKIKNSFSIDVDPLSTYF